MNDSPSALSLRSRQERFERMWTEHHARVLGYVLRRASSGEDAADVVADTFLVAWRRLDDAPAADTHLWLFGVARRVLANHRRGKRRRTYLADRLRREWTEHDPVRHETANFPALAAAFRTLSEADRELLRLDAWEDLDAGEIAAVLGCSRNAVRIRLHRARRRLQAACDALDARANRSLPARPSRESAVTNGEAT